MGGGVDGYFFPPLLFWVIHDYYKKNERCIIGRDVKAREDNERHAERDEDGKYRVPYNSIEAGYAMADSGGKLQHSQG